LGFRASVSCFVLKQVAAEFTQMAFLAIKGCILSNDLHSLKIFHTIYAMRFAKSKIASSKRAGIYVRVSTGEQDTAMQEQELRDYVARRNWTLHKLYADIVSGTTEKRPGLDALLGDCRRGRIDVVVVWKFDRFARSLKQLLHALELFRELGIGFVSCTEAIDTSLPHGEMLFQIIGAIAQWERSLIAERVKAGLQHARNQGQRLGRPPLRVLSPEEVAKLRRERVRTKVPFRMLAAKYGLSVWTVHKLCAGRRNAER
jgi:DNA invertase Pin-like site-specific DNA recombinase